MDFILEITFVGSAPVCNYYLEEINLLSCSQPVLPVLGHALTNGGNNLSCLFLATPLQMVAAVGLASKGQCK